MVIADTGFWVALSSRRDPAHTRALAAVERHGDEGFVVTWPVITEACHLLAARAGTDAVEAFLRGHARGGYEIAPADLHSPERVLPLMEHYRDLPMDLADASLVLLAAELGHGRILTTDSRDFHTYRWKSRAPFENLL